MELIEFNSDKLAKAVRAARWRLGAGSYFASIGQFALPLVGLRPFVESLFDLPLKATALAMRLGAFLVVSMILGAALGALFGGFVGDRLSKVRHWTRLRRAFVGMTTGLLPSLVYVVAVLLCLKMPDIIIQYHQIIIVAAVGCAACGIVVAERM
jgi:MFS family permease